MKIFFYFFMLIMLCFNVYAVGECMDIKICDSKTGYWEDGVYKCYIPISSVSSYQIFTIPVTVDTCSSGLSSGRYCVRFYETTNSGYKYHDKTFCYNFNCPDTTWRHAQFLIQDYNSIYNNPIKMYATTWIEGVTSPKPCNIIQYNVNLETQSDSSDNYKVIGDFPTREPQMTEGGFIAQSNWFLDDYFFENPSQTRLDYQNMVNLVCYPDQVGNICQYQGSYSYIGSYFSNNLENCRQTTFNCNYNNNPIINGINICTNTINSIDNYLNRYKRPLYFAGIEKVYYGTSNQYYFELEQHWVILGKTGSNYLVQQGDRLRVQMSETELYNKIYYSSSYKPKGVWFDCSNITDSEAEIIFNDEYATYGNYYDGISFKDYSLPTFGIDSSKEMECLCYDLNSDGQSTSKTEFDYCIYKSGYKSYCEEKSEIFDYLCDIGKCYDGLSDLNEINFDLDNSEVGYKMIDAFYLSGVTTNDFRQYDIPTKTFYVINRLRNHCDGEDYITYGDVSGFEIELESGDCYENTYLKICDSTKDDEYCYSATCYPSNPCRTETGDSSLNRCSTSSECIYDSECSKDGDWYVSTCYYNGSSNYNVDRYYFGNTCGGYGYYKSTELSYANVSCSTNKVCDAGKDGDGDYSIPSGQCKINYGYGNCYNYRDCFGEADCNSQNRCGECFSISIENNSDCNNPDKPYCTGIYGYYFPIQLNYTCQCDQIYGWIDTCLKAGLNEECEGDEECNSNYFCNGTLYNPGKCLNRLENGLDCTRDNMCLSSDGCNNQSKCGECYPTTLLVNDMNNPICMSNSTHPYCVLEADKDRCNSKTAFICDCCDSDIISDCCLDKPRSNKDIFITCDGDCECANFSYSGSLNITCISYESELFGDSYCADCLNDSICVDKYGLAYRNYCTNNYLCSCNKNGYNPTGCDLLGFCFGKLDTGYACDCGLECKSGICQNGTSFDIPGYCAGIFTHACIAHSNFDNDTNDDFILNKTGFISLNASCSTTTDEEEFPIVYSCWKDNSNPLIEKCFSNATIYNIFNLSYNSSQICQFNCPNSTWYNLSWDAYINFTSIIGRNIKIILKVGNGFLTNTSYSVNYDTLTQNICFRGDNEYCGESCFDGIKNQDETNIDYGGICGNCSDSIKNGNELEVDYGGKCGSCYDGILNGYENNTLNETEIDYGGWCGYCNDSYLNTRLWETMVDYGGSCGTCFNNIFDERINETDIDYGGYFCGSCEELSETNSQDTQWKISRQLSKAVPFDKSKCEDSEEIVTFVGTFIIILITLVAIVLFIFFLILLIPFIFSLISIYRTTKIVYSIIKDKKISVSTIKKGITLFKK